MIQDITGSELNVGDVVIAAVKGDLRIIRIEEIVNSCDDRFVKYYAARSSFLVKAKTTQTTYFTSKSKVYRYFSGPFYKVNR